MTDNDVARMIVESLGYQLSALPESVWDHARQGGCSPALVDGLRAAREAFHLMVTENDIVILGGQIHADVREGLAALDESRS